MRLLLGFIVVLCVVHNGLCCGKGRKKGGKPGPLQPAACQGAVNCLVGPGVTTAPYTPGGDNPGDCSQLKCNLDDSSSCSWTNAQPPADQLNWVSASGQGDPNKLQSSFGTQTNPDGNYFLTASDVAGSASQTAVLYSAPISCANGDVTVKVKHWQSQGLKLQVCEEHDPAGPPENCQDLPATSGQSDTVTVPKGENIRIVIQAVGFQAAQGSVAIVDDIEVQCDPCASTTQPTTAGPGTTTPTAGKPPCKEIVCDFESGSPCAYSPSSSGGSASENWGVKSAPYKNRLTGVPKPSSNGQKFGAAYTKKKGEKTTLSTDATFDKDYVVRYQHYKATQGQTFKACCNDESNCPKETTGEVQTADYKAWKTESILCPAGTKKVLFICENKEGASEGACGIDDIRLLQPSGGNPDDASQSAC